MPYLTCIMTMAIFLHFNPIFKSAITFTMLFEFLYVQSRKFFSAIVEHMKIFWANIIAKKNKFLYFKDAVVTQISTISDNLPAKMFTDPTPLTSQNMFLK